MTRCAEVVSANEHGGGDAATFDVSPSRLKILQSHSDVTNFQVATPPTRGR